MAENMEMNFEGQEIHECPEYEGWTGEMNTAVSDEAMAAASGGKKEDPNWWKKYSDKAPKYGYHTAVFWKGHEEDGVYLTTKVYYVGAAKRGAWVNNIENVTSGRKYKGIAEVMLYRA